MVQLPVLVAPSARDLTRDYMIAQLAYRGITAGWTTGIPPDRPERFFTIEELNSTTQYGIFADAQLIQIRGYDAEQEWLSPTMRLIKALWAVMPSELRVQDVEHAGGPLYDVDPNVPGLRYGQVISWVTVMNSVM